MRLYCNPSRQHRPLWTDMEELLQSDWVLIHRHSLPPPPRCLLLTWLLRRTRTTVSNKRNRKNSAQNGDALAEETPACFIVCFFAVAVLAAVDHFLASSAAFPFHSYLQAEKNALSMADSLHSQRKGKSRPGGKEAPTGTTPTLEVCSSSVNSRATLAKNEITFLVSCV